MTPTTEIMTLDEVAEYLRVSERTVEDWCSKGEIPCGKLGASWRFKRSEIEHWVNNRLGAAPKQEAPRPFSLGHLVVPDRVLLLPPSTKREALETLVANLAEAREVQDATTLAEAVFRREDLMSTGIGMGVAVPHVRIPSVSDLVMSVGLCRDSIPDYQSLDTTPIKLMFLIAARETQHAQHLKTLSSISAVIRDVPLLHRIFDATAPDELHALLTGSD